MILPLWGRWQPEGMTEGACRKSTPNVRVLDVRPCAGTSLFNLRRSILFSESALDDCEHHRLDTVMIRARAGLFISLDRIGVYAI